MSSGRQAPGLHPPLTDASTPATTGCNDSLRGDRHCPADPLSVSEIPPESSPAPAPGDPQVCSPMEGHGGYRGPDWSPQRLMFHQNLESFADRIGLIVGLQANGKLSQEQAYGEIRKMWKQLKQSKDHLLEG